MKDLIKNTLLYFSAFVPMYVLIVVKFIFGFISKSVGVDVLTVVSFITYCVLTILGVFGLIWNTVWQDQKSVTITVLKSHNITDQHFLGYFSLFVLFALPYELSKLGMFVISLLIITFIGIVYVNNQMFYINPLLNLLGYNFYDITYTLNDQKYSAKMFYKGKLDITHKKTYRAIIKNEHFSFLDKQ